MADNDPQATPAAAGPGLDGELTKEEQKQLEELGWHFDEEFDSWCIFT